MNPVAGLLGSKQEMSERAHIRSYVQLSLCLMSSASASSQTLAYMSIPWAYNLISCQERNKNSAVDKQSRRMTTKSRVNNHGEKQKTNLTQPFTFWLLVLDAVCTHTNTREESCMHCSWNTEGSFWRQPFLKSPNDLGSSLFLSKDPVYESDQWFVIFWTASWEEIKSLA